MHDNNKPKAQKSATKQDKSPIGALTLDCDLYQHYLDDSNLSDAQKQEFLETLWFIVVSFVDLGFNVNPLQQTVDQTQKTDGCERNAIIRDFIAAGTPDVLNSTTEPRQQSDQNNDVQSSMSVRGSES